MLKFLCRITGGCRFKFVPEEIKLEDGSSIYTIKYKCQKCKEVHSLD